MTPVQSIPAVTPIEERGYAHPEVLVSTDWVAQHLDDPKVRLVESNEDLLLYDTGHIPGAVKVDWTNDLNDQVVRDYIDRERLQRLVADEGWDADADVRERVAAVRAYVDNPDDLLPDHLPSIGLLDDALLIDLALQALQGELADYEDFCHFRRVAADFARVEIQDTALTREQWQQALTQAHVAHRTWGEVPRPRFAPDPRASLFHIT